MERSNTYAAAKAARTREGDRWVALRTLRNPTTTIQDAAGAPAVPPESAPAPERRPVLYEAVVRRHLEARQRLGHPETAMRAGFWPCALLVALDRGGAGYSSSSSRLPAARSASVGRMVSTWSFLQIRSTLPSRRTQ